MNDSCNEPCLVKAGQGSCVLNTVQYQNKFLYSKYNPERTIISLLEKTVILPGTLIIVCSPLLFYGLDKLKSILPEDCILIFCELNDDLKLFTEKNFLPENVRIYGKNDFLEIDSFVRQEIQHGKIRRALRIDFSAGTSFAPVLYQTLIDGISDIINTFWKNRITLQKMGKLYTGNALKNLNFLKTDLQLHDLRHSVPKPIIVCGAGESLTELLSLKDYLISHRNDVYILAVDASLAALKKMAIPVDSVITMECQSAIDKAWTGLDLSEITLIADLCSRHSGAKRFKNRVWFTSRFADCKFLATLKNKKIIENTEDPSGSVGLAAVKAALTLRKNDSVPVYVTGLDFSYSKGMTHAKETFPWNARLYKLNRLLKNENWAASFEENIISDTGKNGATVHTTKILLQYRDMFTRFFKNEKNLFDAGKTGLPLGIQTKSIELSSLQAESENCPDFTKQIKERNRIISEFCLSQKEELIEAKDLLSNGENSTFRNREKSLQEQITDLLKDKDYLYLHFPDGFSFRTDSSFLKRIRAELDSYIKLMS